MPTIAIGQTITQSKPEMKVTSRLPAGKYRFRLVVTDTAGNQSKPSDLVVTVKPRQSVTQPGAVVATDPSRRVSAGNLTRFNPNNLNNPRRPR